jgi:hypothetical protein
MAKRPRPHRPARPGVPPEAPQQPVAAVHQWLARVHASLPPDQYRCEVGTVMDDESKYVRWKFPEKLGRLEIIQLTDVQFGNKSCRVSRFVEYRDWVLAEPYRFAVWTGDMVDLWTPASPGHPADQTLLPNERQLRAFLELAGPMRHRVLGYVGGNHERRSVPAFGDFGRLIAAALRIPYSGGRQWIDVYFGRHQPFRIALWHGRGHARTTGGIAQALDRFAKQQTESQLCLTGHLHQPLIMPGWREKRVPDRLGIRLEKYVAAIGSSFLETFGSYGEVAGFTATDVMMPRAVLEPNGHWEVTLR